MSVGSETSFTSTVSAITDAFGDPTRRRVYLFVRTRASAVDSSGVTASQVATEVGVHPNVARHHLDKLAAGGYLEVSSAKMPGGGAGRPSKRYRIVSDGVDEVPVHADDLVLSLLGRVLDRLDAGEAEQLAEEVGAEYGRAIASGLNGDQMVSGQRSLRSAIQTVADALSAHGFAAHAERRNDNLRIINNHCPFGDVATEHPVICAVDRGMVRGMLSELTPDSEMPQSVVTGSTIAAGDTFCTTEIRAAAGS
jgi:predicted ArsR family transcriptional regulator